MRGRMSFLSLSVSAVRRTLRVSQSNGRATKSPRERSVAVSLLDNRFDHNGQHVVVVVVRQPPRQTEGSPSAGAGGDTVFHAPGAGGAFPEPSVVEPVTCSRNGRGPMESEGCHCDIGFHVRPECCHRGNDWTLRESYVCDCNWMMVVRPVEKCLVSITRSRTAYN